ncbi:hypothetical protein YC2023_098056 [Brassica napus]
MGKKNSKVTKKWSLHAEQCRIWSPDIPWKILSPSPSPPGAKLFFFNIPPGVTHILIYMHVKMGDMPNNKSKHEAIPQDKDLPLLHEYELGREEMRDREVYQGLGQR